MRGNEGNAGEQRLRGLWEQIYGDHGQDLLGPFIRELDEAAATLRDDVLPPEWYREVVVYSLYVDLFNQDLDGLSARLPQLKELGVSCLWLLPILDSPMRDAGFDIRDYRKVRPELLPGRNQEAFPAFLRKAHDCGMRVIFDIAINHTSEEHPWFRAARSSRDNPYRDFYIWSDTGEEYAQARIIFQGIETSNWKKEGDQYFFHRFFDFQPDLNYRNPLVLIEMCRNMLFWLHRGVDGFRADAIPYLWKEEGTDCENLPHTHLIVKFFRQVLDIVRPHTLLLAEACQKPHEVVKYFGHGDECHAGYHFPLMPQIFKAIAAQENTPVIQTLSAEVTPPIPPGTQWFTFLRCHDELSLELVYVTEEDRRYIHEAYCRQPLWDFRQGQGISARLSELMEKDPRKIGLAFSMMLSLPGTPVIYYGDEFGKGNDEAYYREQISKVGKDDTRFLVRGRMDWDRIEQELNDPSSLTAGVFLRLKTLLHARKRSGVFGQGEIVWLPAPSRHILAFRRSLGGDNVTCLHNLSGERLDIDWTVPSERPHDLLGQPLNGSAGSGKLRLEPYAYHWIEE